MPTQIVLEFYLTHTKHQVTRHKLNSCLGICSIFIVVVISASCYTLVQDTPVSLYRQAEEMWGQYDMRLSTSHPGSFLDYALTASLLESDPRLTYHSPRIRWNEDTITTLYPPSCTPSLLEYRNISCPISPINITDSECEKRAMHSASVYVIDFEKEKRMDLGRTFDITNTPKYGQVILTETAAEDMGVVEVGELIHIAIPLNSTRRPFLANYLNDRYFNNISFEAPQILNLLDLCGPLIFPATVSMITEQSLNGKFPKPGVGYGVDAVLNIEHFLDLMLNHLPPALSEAIDTATNGLEESDIRNRSIYNYVMDIYVNHPPNRITPYLSTNYQDILSNMVNFVGNVAYRTGWSQLHVHVDILPQMESVSLTSMSLSVVLNVVIFVLMILSFGLLYSLLVISVDSKNFMFGVFRMLGMTKQSLVYLLISQSLGYSIPAYILGIVIAQLVVSYFTILLEKKGNVELDNSLSSDAIISATAIGIGSSLIAAILPISSALQQNLREVLDVRHSGTKAVKFNLNRSSSFAHLSYNVVTVCGVMVLYGWIIYYFLPQAFLTGDLAELAVMMLALMLGMLFGCVLLGINIQHILELVVVKILLFWEKRPIPNIVVKNLIAHRIRNRKSAVMYSLSLSFVMMITVMIHGNMEIVKSVTLRAYGSYLVLNGIPRGEAAMMEDLLLGNGNFFDLPSNESIHQYIEDFTWCKDSFERGLGAFFQINVGRYLRQQTLIGGMSPNFESVTPQHLVVQEKGFPTIMTGSEQLYTAMGSQRVLVGSAVQNYFKLKGLDDIFMLQFESGSGETVWYQKIKSIGWYSLYPHFSIWDSFPGDDTIIGFSASPRRFGVESIEDLSMSALLIKLQANVVNSEKDLVKRTLDPYGSIWDYDEFQKGIADSQEILDLIFNGNTYMALFLCLFSLVASMSTNIVEQTKEIGILRSLGLTKFEVNKVYVYEALVLILSSSLIGMVIGCVLTFVILQQQTLFTSYPSAFYIPKSIVVSVIVSAIGSAVLSVWFPLKKLGNQHVAQNFRTNLSHDK